MADAGQSAQVVATVRHRLKTVVVRDDMIGWVQAGTKTLQFPGGTRTWHRGELFLLQRGTQWDVENDPAPDGHYRALVLAPGRDLLRAIPADAARPVAGCASLPADTDLADTLQRAARALDPGAAVSPAVRQHRLQEVLMLLAERGWRFDPGLDLTWAERVRQRIARHPHESWHVTALADAFLVSPSTLQRRLAADGTSASDLVREVRLETALGLLHGTDLPVGEIATRCGYESHSRFSAAFRTRFGLPPSDLRPVTPLAQRMTRPG
ncbi:AraC family transcriptional regulator [Rhizobacter sp. Root1221]|uniref:helix-turn-helix transcriptional regulator n=1 Tax=Rhizobacter sp. Root1221 TaxID=1736433 RepID=UPI0006FB94F2|nr:AraC family transcriptional regulator [Rhizobacter sp. Root1221]KQV94969.1 hypothetical protein ASC87_25555 [Rhizobacter sp. Root1221]